LPPRLRGYRSRDYVMFVDVMRVLHGARDIGSLIEA
jgi:hypothetical protein